jgi:RNA polymerase sigma factor (TIGR02999 family)
LKGSPDEVTQLLIDWGNGDKAALDRLTPIIYQELHRLASRHISRERPNHTLQTTALVHEAYIKLVDQKRVRWLNRSHFFSIAARIMRRILVDHARRRGYAKRGGSAQMISIGQEDVAAPACMEILDLHEALQRLSAVDHRKSQVVELRYFGGLSVEETAEVLNVSSNTVMRDWNFARTWLYREIKG